jgi:hypothetical protein
MAIAPNTTFVSGAILTAAQQNAFGFSTMQLQTKITSDSPITTIATQITLSNFTAIANRNYKITYFEPVLFCSSGVGEATMTIKNGATTIAQSIAAVSTSVSGQGNQVFTTTFTAGTVSLTASLTYGGVGSLTASRSATRQAFMLVEDIGPA